jgi:Na+-translocating ferredoxin:NAD+ oxidoreductase RnfC subunit
MSENETIVRVSATYHLTVDVGDTIHRGDAISQAPEAQISVAPVSGTVRDIRFDPQNHEFVIAILPADRMHG